VDLSGFNNDNYARRHRTTVKVLKLGQEPKR